MHIAYRGENIGNTFVKKIELPKIGLGSNKYDWNYTCLFASIFARYKNFL